MDAYSPAAFSPPGTSRTWMSAEWWDANAEMIPAAPASLSLQSDSPRDPHARHHAHRPRSMTPPPSSSPRMASSPPRAATPPSYRSIKPPLPVEARSPTTPRSLSPSPRSSSPGPADVRPRFTPRTSAGRAKLSIDAGNFEQAELTRQLRAQREQYRVDFKHYVQETNAYNASHARSRQLLALQEVRDQTAVEAERAARELRREANELRRQHAEQRREWEEYGRSLKHVHNNHGARVQREHVAHGRVRDAIERRRESEHMRRICAHELAERERAKRERAQSARHANAYGLRSASEAELLARQEHSARMRHDLHERDRARFHSRRVQVSSARASHDQVFDESSRYRVAEFNAAERERKAEAARQLRDDLHSMRRERMLQQAAERARKQAMHDAVMQATLGGSPFSTTELGARALDGVRRLSGGNCGYSTAAGGEGYYSPEQAHLFAWGQHSVGV